MKLSEFCKLEVFGTNGQHFGRVVELRCAGEPEHGDTRSERIVTELIFGKMGWLERVGLRAIDERKVPWRLVRTIKDGKIFIETGSDQEE